MIENIPDHLLLRQDHPALRSGFVNRRHEYDNVVRLDKVADKTFFVFELSRKCSDFFFQLVNVRAVFRADVNFVFRGSGDFREQIGLVEHYNIRNFS